MANECYIKNTKNYSPKEVLNLIKKEIKDKFYLKADTYIESFDDYTFLEIKIKGLNIHFFLNKDNNFSFYETPHSAYFKSNSEKSSYSKNFSKYIGMRKYFSVYSYLHEYIINFLAKYMEVNIESDGAGEIVPFDNLKKYSSYQNWFEYWKEYHNNQNFILRMITISPNKIKKQELSYFPELSF